MEKPFCFGFFIPQDQSVAFEHRSERLLNMSELCREAKFGRSLLKCFDVKRPFRGKNVVFDFLFLKVSLSKSKAFKALRNFAPLVQPVLVQGQVLDTAERHGWAWLVKASDAFHLEQRNVLYQQPQTAF